MAWKSLIFTRQLSVIAQQSIPKYAVNVNLVQKSLRDDDIQVLKCSGPGSPESPKNSADKPNKLTEQQLKERQVKLCNITDQFFHQVKIFLENQLKKALKIPRYFTYITFYFLGKE